MSSKWSSSVIHYWFTKLIMKNGPLENIPVIVHTLNNKHPSTLRQDPSLHSILETVSFRRIQYALTSKSTHFHVCQHLPKSKSLAKLTHHLFTGDSITPNINNNHNKKRYMSSQFLQQGTLLNESRFWPFPILQLGNHFILGSDCIFEELEHHFVHPSFYPSPSLHYGTLYKTASHHLMHWTDKILQSVTNHFPSSYPRLTSNEDIKTLDGTFTEPPDIPHIKRLLKGYSSSNEFVHGTIRPHLSDFAIASLCWYLEQASPYLLNEVGQQVLPSKLKMKSIYDSTENYLYANRVDDIEELDETICLDIVAKKYGTIYLKEEKELQKYIGQRQQFHCNKILSELSRHSFSDNQDLESLVILPGHKTGGTLSWINSSYYPLISKDLSFDLVVTNGKFKYLTKYGVTIERIIDGVKYIVTIPRKNIEIRFLSSMKDASYDIKLNTSSQVLNSSRSGKSNSKTFSYLD